MSVVMVSIRLNLFQCVTVRPYCFTKGVYSVTASAPRIEWLLHERILGPAVTSKLSLVVLSCTIAGISTTSIVLVFWLCSKLNHKVRQVERFSVTSLD